MCATSCSFCKKTTAKLVPHYLCDCCLVHVEFWEETSGKRWASPAKPIIPLENAHEKVACDICLEKYPEDKLEEHRKLCMALFLFRCSVCDGDYVSKEGMWNHLDQHEIADQSKELYYKEMRASYKLYKCALCNDQRGYQETIYWRHVHEEHDGFFLRCSDCGENFRSEKRKNDHAVTHCQAKGQTVAPVSAVLKLGQDFGKILLPQEGLLQNKQSDSQLSLVPKVFIKKSRQKPLILPEKTDFGKNNCDQINVDFQFSGHSSASNYDVSMAEKESKIQREISLPNLMKTPIVSPAEKVTFVVDEKQSCDSLKVSQIQQHQPVGTSNVSSKVMKNSGEIKCTYCGRVYHNKMLRTRHYINCHKPTECTLCKKTFNGSAAYQYHKLMSHSEPQHKCHECQLSFYKKSAYKYHLASRHQKKTETKEVEQEKIPCERSVPINQAQTYKAVPLYAIASAPQIVYYEVSD